MKDVIAIAVASLVLCAAGCSADAKVWRSDHFNITATLPPGWRTSDLTEANDGYDRPGELEIAFLHNAARCSYVIKIDDDNPLTDLSPDEQLASYRQQYKTTAGLELVDETEVAFHDRTFQRFRVKMPGNKGPVASYIHIRHDGGRLTKIVWLFPLSEDGAMNVPDAITELDRSVQLDI